MSTSRARKLRYRDLLEHVSTLDDETHTNAETVERLSIIMSETNNILSEGNVKERARHPGEGFLDSHVLRATSSLVIKCSESISGNSNTYDKDALATHISENPGFWEFSLPRTIPAYAYLYGTFAPTPLEERPRASRRRVERQRAGEPSEPEAVEKLDKTDEGSEMVGRVYKFLVKRFKEDGRPLSYFHLVVDPASFGRTVENIYHVSFLVRDGLVSVDVDEEAGLPFVRPVAERKGKVRVKGENQFIVTLDMERWQQAVDAFGITRPMMVINQQ